MILLYLTLENTTYNLNNIESIKFFPISKNGEKAIKIYIVRTNIGTGGDWYFVGDEELFITIDSLKPYEEKDIDFKKLSSELHNVFNFELKAGSNLFDPVEEVKRILSNNTK